MGTRACNGHDSGWKLHRKKTESYLDVTIFLRGWVFSLESNDFKEKPGVCLWFGMVKRTMCKGNTQILLYTGVLWFVIANLCVDLCTKATHKTCSGVLWIVIVLTFVLGYVQRQHTKQYSGSFVAWHTFDLRVGLCAMVTHKTRLAIIKKKIITMAWVFFSYFSSCGSFSFWGSVHVRVTPFALGHELSYCS